MFKDKVLVFDLDGTLYNVDQKVEDLVDAKVKDFFKQKLKLNEAEANRLIKDIRKRYQYDVEALDEEYPFSKKDFMDFICNVDVSFLPQDHALDAKLKEMPQRKFILTDSTKKHVLDVLLVIGVATDNFVSIFDGHDMAYTFKHNHKGFKLFLDNYSLKAKDCLLFEDNPCNLEVAKEMGFTTVLISQEDKETPSFCDYRFADIKKALEYFA